MIIIEVLNYSYKPLPKIKMGILERRSYEHYLAEIYVLRIKEKINKQEFDRQYQPLSTNYLRSKTTNNERTGFWERTGILESLVVAKKAMFNPRVTFKYDKRKYTEISRYLEYGTFQIPPRPLFREVLNEIREKEMFYYLKFREERK